MQSKFSTTKSCRTKYKVICLTVKVELHPILQVAPCFDTALSNSLCSLGNGGELSGEA